MSEDKVRTDRMIELLEELVKWTKATSIPQVREILEKLVQTPGERIAYKFSDGKRTLKELSKMSGIDAGELSRDWKKWTRGGIAEQIPAQGGSRGKSLFSLEDFGIEVPAAKAENAPEEAKKETTDEKTEASK